MEIVQQTPGDRIRAKRLELGISQAKLAKLVGLTEREINKIEVGTRPIATIADSYLPKIAIHLGITAEHILSGELHSERSTREELLKMRREGVIRSEEELESLDKFAMGSIRQRNNAKIPLSRAELLMLLEVMRGADGY